MNKVPCNDVLEDLSLPDRFKNKLKMDLDYILQSNISTLELILLFGSCANGRLKVTSDIDLMIITAEKPDQTLRGDIASELAEPVKGVSTDVVFYTVDEVKSGKSSFLKQVMKEGLIIWKKA